MTAPPTFSLLTQPWIACQHWDGSDAVLSIRDIFDGSHQVRAIRGDSPAQDYAVLRVLLAIFWRAHRHETKVAPGDTFSTGEWMESSLENAAAGEADTDVLHYLAQYQERFDLLHPETPFMQVVDLHTEKNATFPVSRIVPEAEGNYFTMRTDDGRAHLSFAEAARWLIYIHAYDYSGIKSGAVGDPRVKGGKGYPIGTGWSGMTGGTVIEGTSLRETLVLNTTSETLGRETDRPPWERAPDTAAERENPAPQGAADLATWQTRRVRLFFDDEQVKGVLVSNGDRIPEAGANILGDPMTPYRYSKNQSKRDRKVYYPRPYDVSRTMWRSLEPLISLENDPGYSEKNIAPRRPSTLTQLATLSEDAESAPEWVNLHLVSVAYGPQSSSVGTTVSTRIELPVGLLRSGAGEARRALLDNAQATSEAAIALGSFAGMLAVAAGGEYEFQPASADSLLTQLELQFITWLKSLRVDELDTQARSWQRHVRRQVLDRAAELLRGAGPKALIGREVGQPGDSETTTITSAGSAYRWLQRKITEVLPLGTTTQSQQEAEVNNE